MPTKFFCDYCGLYLKNSSPYTKRQHADGKKHKQNKTEYYRSIASQLLEEMMNKKGMPHE